jgi:hypothetical protein
MIDFVAWLLVCVMDSVAVVGFLGFCFIVVWVYLGDWGGGGGGRDVRKRIFGFGELTFVF